MPFKSQAQRRKFAQLLVEGKISPETFEEWNRETGGTKLPERAPSRKASKKRSAPGAQKRATARGQTTGSQRAPKRARTATARRATKKR
jgi:hypothetical protein